MDGFTLAALSVIAVAQTVFNLALLRGRRAAAICKGVWEGFHLPVRPHDQ